MTLRSLSETYRFSPALLVLLLAIGCGPPQASPSDPELAKALLEETLDAWKQGATIAEIREQTPPVYVAEDIWLSGSKLQDYQLVDEGERFGTNIRFHVKLKVAGSRGAAKQRNVSYLVTTTPALTIAREDR